MLKTNKLIDCKKIMVFYPNKDSLWSTFWVLGSNGLRPVRDGRIELVSRTGRQQTGEVTARTVGMGNLKTFFPKQGRVKEQIRSRINLKLWDCSWIVSEARVNHKRWGLSRNDPKWRDQLQRRDHCVSVSLSKALGWSECKISVEQILHSDPAP